MSARIKGIILRSLKRWVEWCGKVEQEKKFTKHLTASQPSPVHVRKMKIDIVSQRQKRIQA